MDQIEDDNNLSSRARDVNSNLAFDVDALAAAAALLGIDDDPAGIMCFPVSELSATYEARMELATRQAVLDLDILRRRTEDLESKHADGAEPVLIFDNSDMPLEFTKAGDDERQSNAPPSKGDNADAPSLAQKAALLKERIAAVFASTTTEQAESDLAAIRAATGGATQDENADA